MIALFKSSRCSFCEYVGVVTGPSNKTGRICAICAGQATGMFLQASVDDGKLVPFRPEKKAAAPPSVAITLRIIIKTVARHYGVLIDELTSKSRAKTLATMRDVAMFLCKQETQASSTEICAAFGGRDHTALKGALDRTEARIKAEPTLSTDLAALKNLIYNAISVRNLEAFAKGAQGQSAILKGTHAHRRTEKRPPTDS